MEGKTILIVEDDKIIIKTLGEGLKQEGFNVIHAYDGEQGLESISENKPDLVLLDIIMPKMDGFTMLKKLRSMPDIKDTPVIVLSNLSSANDTAEAVEEGVNKYLVKTDWKISDVVRIIKESLQ